MPEPVLSDEHTVAALDTEVRRDLRGLQKDTADSVARHLVAAGSLVEEDPQLALEHARYARRRASRIAVVREAAGITAYHAGEWAEALAELRAARRMGGGPVHLPVMADIERALGRPERAIDIARGPEAAELGTAERIELAIVGAGARRDLGELDAAVIGLQLPELDPARRDPWSARLFYAHADNLLAAGRDSDALQWFGHAVDADTDGATDADVRIAELTGEELADGSDDYEFGEEELAELVGSSVAQNPVDPDPVDPDPAETNPAETNPAETNPAETNPAETNPAGTNSADTEGAGSEPADREPTGDVAGIVDDGSVDGTGADSVPDAGDVPESGAVDTRVGDAAAEDNTPEESTGEHGDGDDGAPAGGTEPQRTADDGTEERAIDESGDAGNDPEPGAVPEDHGAAVGTGPGVATPSTSSDAEQR